MIQPPGKKNPAISCVLAAGVPIVAGQPLGQGVGVFAEDRGLGFALDFALSESFLGIPPRCIAADNSQFQLETIFGVLQIYD